MIKVLHNLLSILIPYFGIGTIYSFFMDIVPFIPRFGFWEFAIILIIGLVCQFISSIVRKEKAGAFSYVRIPIFIYMIYCGILLVIKKGNFVERSIPDSHQLLIILITTVQYIFSINLSKLLFEQEQFIMYCKGYKGNELFSKLREQGDIIVSSSKALNLCVTLSFIPTIFVVLISLALGHELHPVSSSTILFSIVSCFFSALTFAYVSLTKDERLYAGKGLQTVFEKSKERFKYSLVIIFVAALTALFFANPDAVFVKNGQIPFYILFLRWLSGLLSSREKKISDITYEGFSPEEYSAEYGFDHQSFIRSLKVTDFSWLGNLIRITGIILIVITVLILVFGPFLKKDWLDFWRQGKLWKYIKQQFTALLQSIKSFFSGDKERKKPIVLSEASKKLADSLNEFANFKKTKEKKAEIGKLSKKYVELCQWGERAGSPCTKATAPLEYAKQLYAHAGWYKIELYTAAEIFEKALFSVSLLSKEEEKEFFTLIDMITSLSLEKSSETYL